MKLNNTRFILINNTRLLMLLKLAIVFMLFMFIGHAFADGGTDVLAGTTSDVSATIGGTGRKWIYIIEGVSALIAYRATKNEYVLGSVIAVAIFLNVLLAMSA